MARPNDRVKDPKTIITPHAFRVAPELLGLRLGGPARRAAAMLVDLALIGLLVLLKAISVTLFGLAGAWVLYRLSSRKVPGGARRSGPRAILRLAAVLVLLVTVASFFEGDEEPPAMRRAITEAAEGRGQDAGSAIASAARMIPAAVELRRARTAEEAEPTAREVAVRLRELGVPAAEIREALSGMLEGEGERPWAPGVVERAVELAAEREEERAAERTASADSLVRALAAALEAGDSASAAALRPRAAEALGAEAGASLGTQVSRLTTELQETRRELRRARERAEAPSLRAAFLRLLNDLGLGFGWAGLYFTVFLVLWDGQTPGKRLLGLRAVRLNGERFGWWYAFERFAGYAAGLATGLLGFFQILWDANRQALHDKIVGSVVVRSGPEADRALAALRGEERPSAEGGERPRG